MQFLLVLSLFFFSLALGSPADVLDIKKLVADEARVLGNEDYARLATFFTRNATYNDGTGPDVHGIDAIIATLSFGRPPGYIIQNTTSTYNITVLDPPKGKGAARTGTGVVITIISYVGALAGQAYKTYAKYEDIYVRTRESSLYGGWRISRRFIGPFDFSKDLPIGYSPSA